MTIGKKEVRNTKVKRSIKTKLILIIAPLVVIAIGTLLMITYTNSRKIIMDDANQLVKSLTKSNANEIETWSQEIISSLNQVQNTLNNVELDTNALMKYLKSTMNQNDSFADGVYVGTDKQELFTPFDFTMPSGFIVTERDWFKEGLENEHFQYGTAYLDAHTGEYIVSASAKLKSANGVKKVASVDISLKEMSKIISTKKIMETGRLFIVDITSSKILAINDETLINTDFNVSNNDKLIAEMAARINLDIDEFTELTLDGSKYSVDVQSIKNTPWKVIGYIPHSEILETLNNLQIFVFVLFLGSMIVLVVLVERVIHYIIKPVKNLNTSIEKITSGDFSVDVSIKGNDEIAMMCNNMQKFIETMRGTIIEVTSMSNSLEKQSDNSTKIAQVLYDSAQTQSNAMLELNQTVDELARAVTDVAENTTSLSMVASETGQKGKDAGEKMKDTVMISEKGKEDMLHIDTAMKSVDFNVSQLKEAVEQVIESSEKINDIVKLIADISSQTNLLSLNAAIEAARAGESGRGFSVVAEEIRKLAETSESSVRSIAELNQNIQKLVTNTVDKTQESTDSIKNSINLIQAASDTFNKIYVTISETSDIVEDMIVNVNRVDDVATSVAAITQEQSAAAEEILATSENLSSHAATITEHSFTVEQDASVLSQTAENLNNQMKFFKI
ncbi:methyl-accepting chemotaxis protein [Lachnoclostridium phytofermentans]|uniref:Methyl-accepting chemotaxis sensory transducer n=1 Tax=Lachnoclostridium phytofermentans (strain ATCC 700394 / DSM 18823 / ISDg) TaxID=357809 RepID=A9KPZ5_LACP7|nr:methyl-accepting chemotaxis protein [Lachnoclostridium phytofermentans]ABX41894.1 methyl-accepting chemotaxis sensory transducer [Lachnoclostridium phytofermentans ISDg]